MNLQPAVLETAALPVELRPFRMALLAGRTTRFPGLTQTARSPLVDLKPTDSALDWENPELRV